MRYANAAIPAGFAWTSPFARWQGPLADVPALELAAAVTRDALDQRGFAPDEADGLVLGWTVPQPDQFFGATLLAGRLGAPGIAGPMVSQACATSVAALNAAAGAVEAGAGDQLVVVTDRTSNGPQLIFPTPAAQGGAPTLFHWVLDNFQRDPSTGVGMLAAGDAVAAEMGVTKSELDELKILRHEQYERALADDRAFQRRYVVPVRIEDRRDVVELDADHGVRPLDPAAVRKLAPADPAGSHSFAAQTFPADGCAGALVTSTSRARELSAGRGVVRLLSSAQARVGRSRMPEAPVPAARKALCAAGLSFDEVDAVTTHNPFAVNDLYFSAETGIAVDRMNLYGSSLVYGHPQGPTGLRSIAELIEVLRLRGGGIGLFTGCAAGDVGAAVVLRVED